MMKMMRENIFLLHLYCDHGCRLFHLHLQHHGHCLCDVNDDDDSVNCFLYSLLYLLLLLIYCDQLSVNYSVNCADDCW